MRNFLLELVPLFFRTRWPMKRFYYQKEDLERAEAWAKETCELLGWATPDNKTGEGE
jgi:hypothetical protein